MSDGEDDPQHDAGNGRMSLAAIDVADSDDEDVAAQTALNGDGGRRRDVQRDVDGAGPAAGQGPLGRLVRAAPCAAGPDAGGRRSTGGGRRRVSDGR
jgi:hypothetical protein